MVSILQFSMFPYSMLTPSIEKKCPFYDDFISDVFEKKVLKVLIVMKGRAKNSFPWTFSKVRKGSWNVFSKHMKVQLKIPCDAGDLGVYITAKKILVHLGFFHKWRLKSQPGGAGGYP